MAPAHYAQIRAIAEKNLDRMRQDAAYALDTAKANPLNPMAVAKAIETKATMEGYERAVRELLDGMIEPLVAK